MKLMLFNSLFMALVLAGCSTGSNVKHSNTLLLKQNSVCIDEVKMLIKALMSPKKVFIGDSIFKHGSRFRLSTQLHRESPLLEKQIIKEFILVHQNDKCYVSETELLGIRNKKEIDCSCFNL